MSGMSAHDQVQVTQVEQRSPLRTALAIVAQLVFALGALLLALERWLAETWAELSPDEILFHLRASLAGTDTTVIKQFVKHYLSFVLLGIAVALLVFLLVRRRGTKALTTYTLVVALIGAGLGGVALKRFSDSIGLAYFLPVGGKDFVEEHYANPAETEVTFPERKRNLVYIFLESMELTYADEAEGGAWEENLIPELTELAHEGETFAGDSSQLNGALVLPGCTWTMGGMFAQSSGVPLKLPIQGNQSSMALDDFFPDLTCLGDILEREGYEQTLLIGSDASFGNRREYYTSHGDFNILDYNRALEDGTIPSDYFVFWGFEDEKLFAKARETLTEAAKGDEPFNLTMLTVDTHFEDGYVCHLCGKEHGDNQYANVMSCSSRQVAEFVRWIQAQDFYEDTTIILNGDHTTMDRDFCKGIPESYQRRTYTTIINGAATPEDPDARREYATIDLFPTTLAALGCTIEGDRLGLGTNLYGSTPTLIEELGLDEVTMGCSRQSEFLNSYSNAPKGKELVDAVLSEYEPILVYHKTKKKRNNGFMLRHMHHFNVEVIISPHLELTDTRTGKTKSYPMDIYRTNKNPNSFYLLARVRIPDDELVYYTAEAYATIEGDRERCYATWDGKVGNDPDADEDADETETPE